MGEHVEGTYMWHSLKGGILIWGRTTVVFITGSLANGANKNYKTLSYFTYLLA